MKIFFILLFILSLAQTAAVSMVHQGGGDNLDKPSVPTEPAIPTIQGGRSEYLQIADQYLEKSIIHKPGLEINAYTGDVRTSFQLPLFINNTSFNGLKISYNSSRIKNVGLGYGMKFDLPKLLIKEDGTIQNELGGGELVVVEFLTSVAQARINKVLLKMNLLKQGNVTLYKSQSLENKSLFAGISTNLGMIYVELNLSGENIVYDNNGKVIRIFNLFTNGISFVYQNDKLTSIQNNDYSTIANIDYDSADGLLKKVVIQENDGSKTNVYKFDYLESNLVRVKKTGAIKTLFEGKYKKIKFENTLGNSQIQLEKNQVLVANSIDNYPTSVSQGEDELYINLNADRFTDKIVSNFTAVKNEINAYMSQIKYVKNCRNYKRCLSVAPDSIKVHIENLAIVYKAYIAVLNDNKKIEYKEDKSLEKTFRLGELQIVNMNVKRIEEENWSFETIRPEFETKQIIRYADVDQDGLKDLILCSFDKKLKDQTVVMRNGLWDGQKQSTLSYGLFQFLKNGDSTLFDANGAPATVFLQKQDNQALLKHFKEKMSNAELMINHSLWVPGKFGFNCHQNSLFGEFGQDGKLSILTGTNLYSINENQSVISTNLSLEKIRTFFNPVAKEIEIATIPVDIVDSTGNGKLDLVYSYGSYIDPTTRELKLVQNNGQEIAIKRAPHIPLLVEELSSYGGAMSVEYGYSSAGPIGKTFIVKPTKNPNDAYKIVYNYSGAKIHEDTNTFLGFKKAVTQKNYLNNSNHLVIQEIEFDRDDSIGPVYIKSRARKNGRIRKSTTKDQLNDQADLTLVENSIFIYKDIEVKDFLSYSFVSNSKEFKLASGLVKKSFVPESFNELLIPEKELSTVFSATSSVKNITESVSTYDSNNYLLQKNISFSKNQNSLAISLVEESNFENGQLTSSKSGVLQTLYRYDNYGRFINSESSNGNTSNLSYSSSHLLQLPEAVATNGVVKTVRYDMLSGRPLMIQKESESPMYYHWNNDDILDSVVKSQVTLFSLDTFLLNRIQYRMADRSFSYDLDGFGKFTFLQELDSARNKWEKIWTKKYDFNDQVKERDDFALNSNGDSFKTSYNLHTDGSLSSQLMFNLDKGMVEKIEEIKISRSLEKDKILYTHKITNDTINEEEWSDGLKGVVSRVDGFGEFSFDKESNGKLVGVNNLGLVYSRDANGSIISSQKNSGSDAWDTLNRSIDLNQQTTLYSSGTKEKSILNSLPSTFSNYKTNGQQHFDEKLSYSNGKLVNKSSHFGKIEFAETYIYNSENQATSYNNSLFSKSFEYDNLGRVIKESILNGSRPAVLNYKYTRGQVVAINNQINVKYDRQDRASKISFASGVSLAFSYNHKGQLEGKSFTFGSRNEQVQYTRDINGKILAIESSLLGNKNYEYQNEKLVSTASTSVSAKFQVNSFSSLLNTEGLSLEWNKNELRSINNVQFYNGFNQQFMGACASDATTLAGCLIKLSDDEYTYGGHYYRRIKLGGATAAILIDDTLYPAITDHNDALIGLISADGSKVEFLRTFDDFGAKVVVTGNVELEKKIPFSFGNLIQIPMLNGDVLQSKTRVYLPKVNRWASVDTAAVWSPEMLLNNAGNWNALEYASGDGVNKVDSKGSWAELEQVLSMNGVRAELEVYKVAGLKAIDTYTNILAGTMVVGIGGPLAYEAAGGFGVAYEAVSAAYSSVGLSVAAGSGKVGEFVLEHHEQMINTLDRNSRSFWLDYK
jgi:hypothetical protein